VIQSPGLFKHGEADMHEMQGSEKFAIGVFVFVLLLVLAIVFVDSKDDDEELR
jgi:hypothetical protein